MLWSDFVTFTAHSVMENGMNLKLQIQKFKKSIKQNIQLKLNILQKITLLQ